MSGTDVTRTSPTKTTGEANLDRICEVLYGEVPIEALTFMASSLESVESKKPEAARIAFCLDAESIFGVHRDNDTVDYLAGRHEGLLIVPAQVVQDLWHHTESAVQSASKVEGAYETLAEHVGELSPEHAEFKTAFTTALTDFKRSASHWWATDLRARVAGPLAALAEKALEPHFPRRRLALAASERTATNTPPGVASGSRSHFYIWAEFLLGLLEGRDDGAHFDLAVLVTENRCNDWGFGAHAHPTLVAELHELTGASFEIWSLTALQEYAARALADE